VLCLACEADKRGRKGMDEAEYPQARRIQAAFEAARRVSAKAFVAQGLEGDAIGAAVRKARVEAIAGVGA